MMIYVRRAESEKGLEVRDSEKVYLHLKVSPVLKKIMVSMISLTIYRLSNR